MTELRDPWLLALGLLILGALWGRLHTRPAANPLPTAALLTGDKPLPRSWRQRIVALPLLLQVLALALLTIALARPIERVQLPDDKLGIDIVVCMDVSSSMADTDMQPSASRLALSKRAAQHFIDKRPHDRIGLVRFARYPDLISPVTLDHQALNRLLAAVQLVDRDGQEDLTGIGSAVARSAQILSRNATRSKVIILLTDGEENVASAQAPDEVGPVRAGWICKHLGVRVYAIQVGIGKRDTNGQIRPLDTRQVRQLSRITDGDFFQASDAAGLNKVYSQIDALEKARFTEPRFENQPRHMPFLWSGVGLAVLGLLLHVSAFRIWPGPRPALKTLRLAALGFAGVAIAQPTFGYEIGDESKSIDLVICLDVSRSMLATDLSPTRLECAKQQIARLAKEEQGHRFGIVVFAGKARWLVPLTRDMTSLAEMVQLADPLSVSRGGTDLGQALRTAVGGLTTSERSAAILLLTDGEDQGETGLAAATACQRAGIRVHCIGLGSPLGSKIPLQQDGRIQFLKDKSGREVVSATDTEALLRIATAAGGRSHPGGSESQLAAAMQQVIDSAEDGGNQSQQRLPKNRYQWPLFVGFLLLLWELATARRPARR